LGGLVVTYEALNERLEQLPDRVKSLLCLGTVDDWNSRREQRRWLFEQAASAPAGPALEIGTGYGLSTVIIAGARSEGGGKLISIDISNERIAFASVLCNYVGVSADFLLGDALAVLQRLEPNFKLVLVDGSHAYKYEKGGVEFGKRCKEAKIIVDDVHELNPDAYWINTRSMFGRQLARFPRFFHAVGKLFNDGGTPRLYRELGSPQSYFGRWIVLRT